MITINFGEIYSQDFALLSPEERGNYAIVDVRTDDEYCAGHMAGSIHIPYDELPERGVELSHLKKSPVLLVCQSGMRSQIAAEILLSQGFIRLYNMQGGMNDWTGEVKSYARI